MYITPSQHSQSSNEKVWSVNLGAILSCHGDEDVVNEILFSPLFFPFFVLKIEELKNENALLRAQLQQHGIEMVGETPPQ